MIMEENTRPWHGSESPLEEFYEWVKAEIAKVHAKIDDKLGVPETEDVPTPVEEVPALPAPEPEVIVVEPVAQVPAEPAAQP
jgi:hypothetical protein